MKKIARGILILASAALSSALLLFLAFPRETRGFFRALRETIDGWVERAEGAASLVASAISSFREEERGVKEPGKTEPETPQGDARNGEKKANGGPKNGEEDSSHGARQGEAAPGPREGSRQSA